MRISERRGLVALAMAAALGAVWNCGSSTTCLRYSDCDQGLTCANGLCVVAGDGDADGGDGGDEDDGGSTTTPTPTTTATMPTPTPSADAGTADAMTADARPDDAGIADASTD